MIDIYSKCILGKFILGKSTISVISTCHVHSATLAIYMNVTTSLQSVVSSLISYLSTLRQFGLQVLAPQPSNINFMEWWHKANEAIQGPFRDFLNSLIMLGAWVLWNHRNRCIFDGLSPNIANFLIQVGDERRLWESAGAKGLSSLAASFSDVD